MRYIVVAISPSCLKTVWSSIPCSYGAFSASALWSLMSLIFDYKRSSRVTCCVRPVYKIGTFCDFIPELQVPMVHTDDKLTEKLRPLTVGFRMLTANCTSSAPNLYQVWSLRDISFGSYGTCPSFTMRMCNLDIWLLDSEGAPYVLLRV